MRLATAVMIVGVVVVAAAGAASAASRTAYDDCGADDPDRNISGCTLILDGGRGESERNRAIAYVRRGEAWRAKGDLNHAIADFTSAIGLGPDYFSSYALRGRALYAKDELDRAIADYDQAIRFNPNGGF